MSGEAVGLPFGSTYMLRNSTNGLQISDAPGGQPWAGENLTRYIVPWLLLFVYFPFVYNYGVKYGSAGMPFSDLPSFCAAAKLTFVEHRSPYDLPALHDYGRELGRGVNPYLYPPPSLLVFSPLARVSYPKAKLLAAVVNQLCALALLYILLAKILGFGIIGMLRRLGPAALAIYVLCSRGVTFTLEEGQINLVVVLCVCLSWLAVSREAPAWAAGLPLGLAILIKTYPLAILPLLILRRRYWAAAWALGFLMVCTVVAYGVLPHALWGDWLTWVLPTGGYAKTPFGLFLPSHSTNQSINGFVSRIFLEDGSGPVARPHVVAAQSLAYVMAIAVLAATTWVCRRGISRYLVNSGHVGATDARATRDTHSADSVGPGGDDQQPSRSCLACDATPEGGQINAVDLEFALFLIVSFLVAPLSWEHHLAYVTPAAVVALGMLINGLHHPHSIFSNAVRTVVMLAILVIAWPFKPAAAAMPYILVMIAASAKFYAVVCLWLFLLVTRFRAARFE